MVEIAGITVCHDLALQIDPGSSWAILGGNGAGKTTLLHTLAGVRLAQQGEITIKGQPLSAWPRRQLAQVVGLLAQESSDPFPITVLETVLIGRHPHLDRWQWEGEEDIEIAQRALHQVALEGFESRMVDTLSGGERRRVAIAALMAQSTQLLLLDEPTNHLDLHHQVTLLDELKAVASAADGALISVLHDINLALRFCDHALLLLPNGVTLHGPIDEVVNSETLTELYAHPVIEIANDEQRYFMPR